MSTARHIAIALSGASGAAYFLRLLERVPGKTVVHLIASESGRRILLEECDIQWRELDRAPFVMHGNKNCGASIGSGSVPLDGMVILPCSTHTLASIAAGLAGTLIHRCAAVQLKEDRKLILAVRETPLSLVSLRAMTTLKESGAVIMPACPSFYHRPKSIEEVLDTLVDRIMDHLGLRDPHIKRWSP